jgi:hypothetical protein
VTPAGRNCSKPGKSEVPEIDGRQLSRQQELEIEANAERYGEVHWDDPPHGGLIEVIRRALRRVRRAKDSGS